MIYRRKTYARRARFIRFEQLTSRFHYSCFVQVGVQTMIEPNAGASALEDKLNATHPITDVLDDNEDDYDDDGND